MAAMQKNAGLKRDNLGVRDGKLCAWMRIKKRGKKRREGVVMTLAFPQNICAGMEKV